MTSSHLRLQGKSVLISAAAQGIGRATALACARAGAQVIATDINHDALQDLEALVREHGLADRICCQHLDVCNTDAIRELALRTKPLDTLFNCAGVVHNGSILTVDPQDWDRAFALNVTSMFHMIRAFLPAMLERSKTHSASIINMASAASSIKGFPNRCAYGATKAAVIGLTKSVAADFITNGLRCNAICPGTVDTPSLRDRIAATEDPVQAEKAFIARQPMGRLASAEEIAPLVVYLASDESRFITGQAICVDGGITI